MATSCRASTAAAAFERRSGRGRASNDHNTAGASARTTHATSLPPSPAVCRCSLLALQLPLVVLLPSAALFASIRSSKRIAHDSILCTACVCLCFCFVT